MTDATRAVLARQIATNAVTVFADRIHGRKRQTFQDAHIADQIERLLLEITPLTAAVDGVAEGTDLGDGEDSEKSAKVDAVDAALSAKPTPSEDPKSEETADGDPPANVKVAA